MIPDGQVFIRHQAVRLDYYQSESERCRLDQHNSAMLPDPGIIARTRRSFGFSRRTCVLRRSLSLSLLLHHPKVAVLRRYFVFVCLLPIRCWRGVVIFLTVLELEISLKPAFVFMIFTTFSALATISPRDLTRTNVSALTAPPHAFKKGPFLTWKEL